MPLIKSIRHSPLYLYLKFYSIASLISIFTSAPVTRRLSKIDPAAITSREQAKVSPLNTNAKEGKKIAIGSPTTFEAPDNSIYRKIVEDGASVSDCYPRSLIARKDTKEARQYRSALQRLTGVLQRWWRRIEDLDDVKRSVEKDQSDIKRHPELLLQAAVRCSSQASAGEIDFIRRRSHHIIRSNIISEVITSLDLGDMKEEDIPTVAIGGSGGGYRATFGFISALEALQSRGCLDLIHWLAGVSGSCWSLAALYTVGKFNAGQIVRHYKNTAEEMHHPMSRRAFDTVASSSKGVYFLLAPLLTKLRSGTVGIGIMDMYATLMTTYQLLSRSCIASVKLSKSTLQFSKLWHRLRMHEGKVPMPIFTAVRVRRRNDAIAKDIADEETLASSEGYSHSSQEENADKARRKAFPPSNNLIRYQWWEMNPLEIGSSDEGVWIPSWSYGRTFDSGQSITTAPEISMSLLLGQVTSAPAGPLTGYISTLLATIPKGTIMSYLLSKVNAFVLHKRWENRWGNPIRGADEPNPLYGRNKRSNSTTEGKEERCWQDRKRIKLMDSGLSNNLPNHIFTSSARKADIIISFDFSSDVQTGAALSRLDDFAKQRNLIMMAEEQPKVQSDEDALSSHATLTSEEIKKRFRGKYAQVFHAWYQDRLAPSLGRPLDSGLHHHHDVVRPLEKPHMHLIYCPLLPHPSYPDFDPATSSFSTNYNLIWSPEEIDMIHRTAYNNTIDYIIPTLLQVYRSVYKNERLNRSSI